VTMNIHFGSTTEHTKKYINYPYKHDVNGTKYSIILIIHANEREIMCQ